MDSEQFQDQIDETLRKDQEQEKGKGVDKEENVRNEGEGQEAGETGADQNGDDLAPGTSGQEATPPTTRQSKRKKAAPKPFPPPTTTKPKPVGPIRIKKPRTTSNNQAEEAPPEEATETQVNPKKAPIKRQVEKNPPARHPAKIIINDNQEEESSDDEEEDKGGVAGVNVWNDTNRNDNRPQARTVGGIVLGDIEEVGNNQVVPTPSATDSVTLRLEEAIKKAFENKDRQTYDRLNAEKQAWLTFLEKGNDKTTPDTSEKTSKSSTERKTMKVQRGEMINDHLNALSPYWDTALKEFNRYIPLSIFDPAWLRQDIAFVSNKLSRTKTKDADSTSYNGSPIPNEWRTTVAQWHRQKDLFLQYLARYKQTEVLPVMKAHFENVLEIQKENDGSWVLAYRYDLMMRQSYLVFKVGEDGTSMADIGIRNPRIQRLAERDTLRYNDDMFLDNPYALNGTKRFIDPLDGSNWEGRTTRWDDPSRTDTRDEKLEPTKSAQSM
ncbi:uncharacterized protein MELLADRAFT_94389 [Melampsora larici-populina 98AG31]|uniref:Uncharacterized protein n=1 Tax=Melampsora larici-populina (strain 98AG31 / pathotype 3-4-7) TaxID=747676 RepID=F4RBC0_MELLP|nr:uncharacterized protein MELLADRAFT_94389 [Melampsora larici-populina 98AG31]EGG10058.1 hypothetical protein MELLADRAFT_94389 [Melampsora larici-populina 98AG31]